MPVDLQQSARLAANLAAIEAAISSGVTSASYDGKSTSFRSLSEMRSIRDEIRRQLGLPTRSRRTVATFRSGF